MASRVHGYNSRVLSLLVVVAAGAAVVVFSCLTTQSAISAVDKPAVAGLRQLSDGIVAVAKGVKPAVVNITAKRKATTTRNLLPGGPGLFPKDPFEEFFEQFRRQIPRMPSRPRAQALGSGFVYSSDGYIITNAHVVKDAEEMTVKLSDGRSFQAEVRGVDEKSDLAVLKIAAKGLKTVKLGSSANLEVGEIVIAIGSPFGFNESVTSGIVSAKGRYGMGIEDYENFIQTDAAINPGNSGGPLLNLDGEVVGINTAIFSRSGAFAGIGFAIPIDMAKNIVQQLIEKGKVTRGWLGVGIQNVTSDLAEQFNIPKHTKGVLVTQVYDDTPAAEAKMKAGDVIIGYDEKKVENVNQLRLAVAGTPPGSKAKIKVLREGKEKTLTVKVAEQTPEALAQAMALDNAPSSIGLMVQNLTPEIAKGLGLKGTTGVVVTAVEPDSPADKAGIEHGDVIKQIKKDTIRNIDDFKKAVGKIKPGEKVLTLVQSRNVSRFVVVSVPKE